MIAAIAAGWGGLGLTIALTLILAMAVDQVLSGVFARDGLLFAAAMVVIAQVALAAGQRMASFHAAARRKNELRQALYRHQLSLGPDEMKSGAAGARVHEWVEGVEALDFYYGVYIPQAVIGFSAPVFLLGAVAWMDWVTALALLAAAPIPPMLLGIAGKRFKAVGRQYWAAMNLLGAEFLDSVQGLATLKVFGQGRARADRLHERAEGLRREAMRLLAVNQTVIFFMDWGFAISAMGVAAVVGAWRWEAGALSPGAVFAAILLSAEMIRQINLVAAFFFAGAGGRTILKKIDHFLQMKPQVAEMAGALPPEDFKPSVEFRGVKFRYEKDERLVLDGLDFMVHPGETAGLIGASGAGKSTIAHLLLRMADPAAGEIRISGVSLREAPLDWIRSRIALVAQDAYFFHGTIAENLRMGRPEAETEDLEAAARAANLDEWINSLPDKYGTMIGDHGTRLSGGQAQRLAIARAFLLDAPILVLDEATASLDGHNEAEIGAALARLRKSRTTLIIAHRAGALAGAGRIFALRDGRTHPAELEEARQCLVT